MSTSKPKSESKVHDSKRKYARKRGKRGGKQENPEVMNTSKDSNSKDYNDPGWRLNNASTILDRATKFVFNDFAHVYENFEEVAADIGAYSSSFDVNVTNVVSNTAQIPSILSLRFNPSPGSYVQDRVTAVTQQAQALYTSLSSMNAKTTQYAPQDLIFAILSLGEIISTVEWLRRAFRLMYLFGPKNRAIPRALVEASGFNYGIMSRDYSNLVSELNTVIDRSMAITLPSNIDYFKACAAMYSDVFLDDESDMAQMYVFLPYSTWVLDETTSSEGSTLVQHVWQGSGVSTPLDPHVVITKLGDMVDALLTSSTLNFVYADIQNFASKRGALLYGINPIVNGEAIAPIYSEEALLQIQNTTIMDQPMGVPGGTHTAYNNVYSNASDNTIRYAPRWAYASLVDVPSIMGNMLNFPHMNPTDEEVMTAMRFVAACPKYVATDTNQLALYTGEEVSLPDHYCVDGFMYLPKSDAPLGYVVYAWGTVKTSLTIRANSLSKFRYHPRISDVGTSDFVNADGHITFKRLINGVVGDLNYWTFLPYKTVRTINDGAMLSLFKVNEVFNKYQTGTTR